MSVDLRLGDCRQRMAEMPDNSVDSIVCDPPYHLTSIVDRFGKEGAAPSKVPEGGSGVYARASRGFMGQTWDGGDVAFQVETWREVWRVLKPGGHLLAFSGSRTYHRMACAIENAGFEIRDQIMYVYGSGFPKSLDVSKAIDKAAGAERDVIGNKPSDRPNRHGGKSGSLGGGAYTAAIETAPATEAARQWSGWGTALKPAHEPICMARKPLQGTVAANVLRHGTGAVNVDGCRVRLAGGEEARAGNVERSDAVGYGVASWQKSGTTPDAGRWPANFIHDGSEEATAGLGEASRFFYCAKASRSDREEGCDELPPRTGAEAVEVRKAQQGWTRPVQGQDAPHPPSRTTTPPSSLPTSCATSSAWSHHQEAPSSTRSWVVAQQGKPLPLKASTSSASR